VIEVGHPPGPEPVLERWRCGVMVLDGEASRGRQGRLPPRPRRDYDSAAGPEIIARATTAAATWSRAGRGGESPDRPGALAKRHGRADAPARGRRHPRPRPERGPGCPRTPGPALIGALDQGADPQPRTRPLGDERDQEGGGHATQIAGSGSRADEGETAGSQRPGRGVSPPTADRHFPGRIVDLVGTGGDGARSVNIATMGTIVAARGRRQEWRSTATGRLIRRAGPRTARGSWAGDRPFPRWTNPAHDGGDGVCPVRGALQSALRHHTRRFRG